MKATFIAVLACVCISGLAHSQNQPPNNLRDMTAEEFLEQARAAAKTGAERSRLAALAFGSQNIQLILACFREPGMFGSFIDEMEKLPPTEIRSKVVKALLAESWPMDKSPLGILPPGSAPPPRLEAFCLLELAKLVPSENLNPDDPESIDKLRSKDFRVKLAQQIEANAGASRDAPPNASGNSFNPTANGGGSQLQDQKSQQTTPTSKLSPVLQPAESKSPATELTPRSSIPNEQPPSSTPWSIILVLIVAVLGLLWLLLKRRS